MNSLDPTSAHTLRPLIIDSFAGGGGASTGIEIALGRAPDVAINHSAAALALHAANHPETLHLDSNIWDVEPRAVTRGRRVGLLWASPDCKHFSKAKGGAPRDRNIRDLAWVVVRWAEDVRPDVICMENVEEFQTWGPVDDDGRPIKELAGVIFELWIKRLKRAGYRVQWRELRACDYGAPTIRKRWFLVARRDGRSIRWPKPTHGDPRSRKVRRGKLRPWRTAAECIDWSLPCPSIFDSAAEIMAKHGLVAKRPLAANTLARVARGMRRYVLDADRPFLVTLTHGGRVEPADEPIRTITGAHRGEKAVVVPNLLSLKGTTRRDSAAGAPHPTILAGGGHSAVVVPAIVGCGGRAAQSRARGGDEPCATVTAKADACVTTAFLATMRNSQKPWQGADEPTHTITAGGAGLTLIAPALATYYGHGAGRGMRAADLSEPLRTVTVENRHALIAPSLTRFNGGATGSDLREPAPTVTANGYIKRPGGAAPLGMLVADLVQTGYGERQGQVPRALDVRAPLGTVVAGGTKHAPFAAFLAQQNGGPRMDGYAGRDMGIPISTITATGSQQTPVAAWLAKWYSTPQDPRLDEPLHTVTTTDRFDVETATLAAPPFGPEHHARARQVAEFLRAHDAWGGGEFVTLTIGEAEYVVVDIGLRMLTPRELFNAQGFPADYVIEGVWEGLDTDDPRFRPFPKDVQVSCCGNSVCPPLAAAIVAANCGHLAIHQDKDVRHG